MIMKKLFAEALGTFALVFVVMTAVGSGSAITPWLAGLTLGLFVYFVGHISGTHINPAVTIGAWSIGKIHMIDAIQYIVAQIIGALVAMVLVGGIMPGAVLGMIGDITVNNASVLIFIAEALGMFFFAFGIASVVYGKTPTNFSGLVIGLSLTLGIFMAAAVGSLGALNPAVALGLGSFNIAYIIGPIIGSVLGMQAYRALMTK